MEAESTERPLHRKDSAVWQSRGKIKVAIVSQPWDTLRPPVTSGSIPIWTYQVAKVLARSCQVVIYARHSEQQLVSEVVEEIEYRRVSVRGTKVCNGMAKAGAKLYRQFRYLSSRLYYLPYSLLIAADLRRQSCDVVHIHNFSQFVPAIRALNPAIKIVLHMHCEWLSQFDRKTIAPRLEQCDLIVGCSDYITGKIKARFPEFAHKCQRVYNGVDTDQFASQLDSTEQTNPSKLTVLFVGRISPEKGLHTLIAAFEKVSVDFPDAKLYLVGPDKPTSAEFIAELSDDPIVRRLTELDPPHYPHNLRSQLPPGLKSRVVFPGPVSHLELNRYFQAADVLVNPSLSEAFGMSLVEAMACGIPTVATAVGGMVDIVVPGETGLLVPPDQAAALAEAIAQLLSDKALRVRMGEAGRQRAVERFDWRAIAADLCDSYHRLLKSEEVRR